MECDEHGLEHTAPAAVGGSGLKRKHGAGGARDVRLAFGAAVPGAFAARAVPLPAHAPRARALPLPRPPDSPFMSNMDEISFWVYTKRAPCLFNYDSIIKQQSEQAQCSNTKAPSVVSKEEEPSPKKMRKLKLLEEDSMSTEKQQNVYFKAPQIQKPTTVSCKSEEAGSDIDFNIKASKVPKKSKNSKLQKNCSTRVPKKIKVATSTPKVVNLRRSLRKAQQSCNNNSHLNSSFEIFNASVVNGKQDLAQEAEPNQATNEQNKSKSRSSGASRYPRRQNKNTETPEANCTTTVAISNVDTTRRRYNMRKGTLNMNRKENSEERLVSRTRSGKRRCLQLDVEKSACAVLQLNSSTEPVSSQPAVNVASPNTRSSKNNASTRCLRSRTLRDKVVHLYKESSSEGSDNKLSDGMHCALEQSTPKCVKKVKKTVDRPGQSLGRDSLRDKSGFTACFSDSGSDSDSAPLNQRKFFC